MQLKKPLTLKNLIGHKVFNGDSNELIQLMPDKSISILVTSPPYWGQRTSGGMGVEEDPRDYVKSLCSLFEKIHPKMKDDGVVWINVGDAYNTPINWQASDSKFSSLGADKTGLAETNSAYTKNRPKRRAFIDKNTSWLQYGNLLALPFRMVIGLSDLGYLYRGEVIWKKANPLPEGRCRRPHRAHEGIYLFAKSEDHLFTVSPSIKSVWEFANEGRKEELAHFSRFPEELPRRCLEASGQPFNEQTIVFDPFSGSGTTGVIAKQLGMSYIGFEIDAGHAASSQDRIDRAEKKADFVDERIITVKKSKVSQQPSLLS